MGVISEPSPLPDYANPPVVEVVCGIVFKPITRLLTPYLGLLWERYRAEYPEAQEVAPLDPIFERYDEPPQVMLNISNVPPLPRIWFIQEKGNGTIQVQRDRFLHNWRKVEPNDEYPRYHVVMEMFKDRLSRFRRFLAENELGDIDPLQYEMTYINHIPEGDGWSGLGEIGRVLPDFSFRAKKERFLPSPSGINWQTTFTLPRKEARMHVVARYVKMRETGQPLLLLELTVRGIGEDKSLEGMQSWFDLAREWIVRGFSDLTDQHIQRTIWKKRH